MKRRLKLNFAEPANRPAATEFMSTFDVLEPTRPIPASTRFFERGGLLLAIEMPNCNPPATSSWPCIRLRWVSEYPMLLGMQRGLMPRLGYRNNAQLNESLRVVTTEHWPWTELLKRQRGAEYESCKKAKPSKMKGELWMN